MADIGDHLGRIVGAWTEMAQTGSVEGLAALIDENAVWQGLLPELVCHGREEVLGMLVRGRQRVPRITRIEAQEFGDRVVVSVEGPDFPESPDSPALLPPGAPRSLVFTFRADRVVRMESLPNRDAAFALAAG